MEPDNWLRSQYIAVVKERDELQEALEIANKEKEALRHSIYQLSNLITSENNTNNIEQNINNNNNILDNEASISNIQQNSIEIKQNNNSLNDIIEKVNPNLVQSLERAGILNTEVKNQNNTIEEENNNRLLFLETELKGHSGAVYCAEFSQDGRWLASGSIDRNINVWEMTSNLNNQILSLSGHTHLVSSIAWDNNSKGNGNVNRKGNTNLTSKYIYSTSYDKTVKIWDLSRTVALSTVRLSGLGTIIKAFSPSSNQNKGCLMSLCNTPEMLVIDPRQASIASSWTHTTIPTAIICLDDGNYIVVGDDKSNLSIYDLRCPGKGALLTQSLIVSESSLFRVTHIHTSPINKSFREEEEHNSMSGKASSLLSVQCSDNCLRLVNLSWDNNNQSEFNQDNFGNTSNSVVNITENFNNVEILNNNYNNNELNSNNLDNQIIPKLELVHAFRQHITGQVELKTSFYRGAQFRFPLNNINNNSNNNNISLSSNDDNNTKSEMNINENKDNEENEEENLQFLYSATEDRNHRMSNRGKSDINEEGDNLIKTEIENSLLLATGSSDGKVIIFIIIILFIY
jgi:WD40 repeat protein